MVLDRSLIKVARASLYSAVVSDTLDSLGNLEHAMSSRIRPLDEKLVLFGRARTGLYMEVFGATSGENPYDLEITLVDDLQPDDVAVFACPGSERMVPWGELLSTAAQVRGAAGCVTDGLVRDTRQIRAMGFPVFSAGMGPYDTKHRATVMKIDVGVVCGGAYIHPEDWIFGDVDGVVVIPADLVEETIERSLTKVRGENLVREELSQGRFLREVFDKYQIL
jgi:4-hydroxy-4-methyl-2-oxoglutarate aldolase